MARDMVEVDVDLETAAMKLRGYLALLTQWHGERPAESAAAEGAGWLLSECRDLAGKIETALCSPGKPQKLAA